MTQEHRFLYYVYVDYANIENADDSTVPRPTDRRFRQVSVSHETWTGIKIIAVKTGASISDIVERGLADYAQRELARVLVMKKPTAA